MSLDSLPAISPLLQILAGLLLLFAGRRLFWVFVAVIGFLFGFHFGDLLFPQAEPMARLLVSAGVGLAAALLAVVLQKVAVILAGAAAGGLLAIRLAASAGWTGEPASTIAFIVGAIAVGILALLLFDLTLIVFSSLTGGGLISDALLLGGPLWVIAWLLLVAAGIIVQMRLRPAAPSATRSPG